MYVKKSYFFTYDSIITELTLIHVVDDCSLIRSLKFCFSSLKISFTKGKKVFTDRYHEQSSFPMRRTIVLVIDL